MALAVSAECLTAGGAEVSTALAGVEYFHGSTADGLTVQGSDRAERISAVARYVLVYGGPGADRVFAFGARITQVIDQRGRYEMEFRVVRPDETLRWISERAHCGATDSVISLAKWHRGQSGRLHVVVNYGVGLHLGVCLLREESVAAKESP